MGSYGAWKVPSDECLQVREPELMTAIDQLMRVGGDAIEAIDDVCRVRARTCEGEVLARPTVQRCQTRARERRIEHRCADLAPASVREQTLQLEPLVLVSLLELQRRHHRRPNTHCATPRTRFVTSGPERPLSPDTGAASAASSSRRSVVSVGTRAASATS